MQDWTESEGQVVHGQFPLLCHLGSTGDSGVFLTECGVGKAVIKFVKFSAEQLAAWEAAAKLAHPHLVGILASGEYRHGETNCAYVVSEYADDNLALILAERPLTPHETQEMLGPVVEALVYLHGRGFAHGALKPSNIMAVGDRVVLSSESISSKGEASAADDCLALGVTLKQCIPSLPAPLDEIVRHCLDPNPRTRWSAVRIAAGLRGEDTVASTQRTSRRWITVSAGAILVLAAGTLWYGRSTQSEPSGPPAAIALPKSESAPPQRAPAPEPVPSRRATPRSTSAVVTQVLPDIPQAALDTISGRVRINVRVSVDPSGNVTEASLEPPLASKYFSQFTLKAARRWKFQPADDSQEWRLRFELLPNDTKVSASLAGK